MERPIRINLGSGIHPWPGFVNVDYCGECDVVSDVTNLPMFADKSVDEIHAIHLFEHIDRTKIHDAIAEWKRVLKPGGKLILELPCLDKIAAMIVRGVIDPRLTMFGLFGDPRYESEYMQHRWCYTYDEIREVLQHGGFSVSFDEPVYHKKVRDMRVIGARNE
jgi:predicted SAM-dependent methyltransferase